MNAGGALVSLPLTTLLVLASSNTMGQQKSIDEQIAGAWTYVSVDTVRPDRTRVPMYGPNPQGLVIFNGNGHYALVNARADQPKFASNNRMEGTPGRETKNRSR